MPLILFLYLVGESFTSLNFQFRVGKSTISQIVTETCEALYRALAKDYLKVMSKVHYITNEMFDVVFLNTHTYLDG